MPLKLDPKRAKRRQVLIRRMRGLVPAALRKFPDISKIYIIGSIAKPIFFDLRSDVDVVVDGVSAGQYFELYRFLEERMKSELDLIFLSDIEARHRAILDQKVVIYEKTGL